MKHYTMLLVNRFTGYFSGITGGEYTESSAITRSVMKETAINLIKEQPLIGYGLNTFRTFPGSYTGWCHVNYLELMVSGGILPLIIYYSIHIYMLVRLLKMRRSPMQGMMLTLLLYIFIHDYLSVTYLSRFMQFLLCLKNCYILIEDKEEYYVEEFELIEE